MIRIILIAVFALTGFAFAAEAAPANEAATTQPSAVVLPPSTQPVTVVLQSEPKKGETIAEVFSDTRVGQLFQGKKKVTLAEMRDPSFWIDTIRDLIIAVVGFIPRVLVALLFLGFFWLIYRAVRKIVSASMGKAAVDPTIRDMLTLLIKWSIMGFGVVIA